MLPRFNTKPFATETQSKRGKLTTQATASARHVGSGTIVLEIVQTNTKVRAQNSGRVPGFQLFLELSHPATRGTTASGLAAQFRRTDMRPRDVIWNWYDHGKKGADE